MNKKGQAIRRKRRQIRIMGCKHNWHIVESNTYVDVKLEEVFYYFVCDKCGCMKRTKRDVLLGESE